MINNLLTSGHNIKYTYREEGNLSYYYSKFLVYDFEKRDKYEGLSWLSFLEGLGRIVGYKNLPRRKALAKYGISQQGGLFEFITRIEQEGKSWDQWMAENSTDGEEDPFHERLDDFLDLIICIQENRHKPKRLNSPDIMNDKNTSEQLMNGEKDTKAAAPRKKEKKTKKKK